MKQLVHGSVFSGIGAAEIAASMLGWKNAFHCEIQEFPRKVLQYYFPNEESYEDITTTDFSKWGGQIDVLTGGFPCQPFSTAGKRRGADDDRFLWPHMLRAIKEIRPTWFIAENVGGIRTSLVESSRTTLEVGTNLFGETEYRTDEVRYRFVFEDICREIESAGYSVQSVLIPACGLDAPHRRDRVFFVAHRNAATDSDRSNDGGESRSDESESREERLQERHHVLQSGQPSEVRPEGAAAENTDRMGVQGREDEKLADEPRPRDIESASYERQVGFSATDTNMQSDQPPGPSVSVEGEGRDGFLQPRKRSKKAKRTDGLSGIQQSVADTERIGWDESKHVSGQPTKSQKAKCRKEQPCGATCPLGGGCYMRGSDRWRQFPTQPSVCGGDDGFPFSMDDITIPYLKDENDKEKHLREWREASLKAYGNAIVPQVIYEIFLAIQKVEEL